MAEENIIDAADFLRETGAQSLPENVTKGKAALGGGITGSGSLAGFATALALAPNTGGASFLLPIAGAVAGGFGTEYLKGKVAEDNDFVRSILQSEQEFPRHKLAGEFATEAPLALTSLLRTGTKAGLRHLAGDKTSDIAGDIGKEAFRGAVAGGGTSVALQAGISAVTEGKVRVDPLTALGDAILGASTTKAPLPKKDRIRFGAELESIRQRIPEEVRARKKIELLEDLGVKEQSPENFDFATSVVALNNAKPRQGRKQARARSIAIADEIATVMEAKGIDVKRTTKDGRTLSIPEHINTEKILLNQGEDELISSLIKRAKAPEEGGGSNQVKQVAEEGFDTAKKITEDNPVRGFKAREKARFDERTQILRNPAVKEAGSKEFQEHLRKGTVEPIDSTITQAKKEWQRDRGNIDKFHRFASSIFRKGKKTFFEAITDKKFAVNNAFEILEEMSNGRVPVGWGTQLVRLYEGKNLEMMDIYIGELANIDGKVSKDIRDNLDLMAELGNIKDRFGKLRETAARNKNKFDETNKIRGLTEQGVQDIEDAMRRNLGDKFTEVDEAYKQLRKVLGADTFVDRNGVKTKGLLAFMRDEGYVTQKEVDAMVKSSPNYTPTKVIRFMNDVQDGATKGKSILQYIEDPATDSVERIDFLKNAEEYINRVVRDTLQNSVRLHALRLRRSSAAGRHVIQVGSRKRGAKPPIGMTEFHVREGGKQKVFYGPTDMVEAMNDFSPEHLIGIFKLLSKPANWFRAAATKYSLSFATKNPVRDIGNAIIRLEEIAGPKSVGKFGKFLTEAIAEEKAFSRAQRTGGKKGKESSDIRLNRLHGGTIAGASSELIHVLQQQRGENFTFTVAQHNKDTKGMVATAKKLASLPSELGERAVRLAAFKMVKASGKSASEAAFISRDLLDFAVAGKLTKQIGAAVPFMNARIRGASLYLNLLKKAIKDPEEFGGAFLLKTAITGFLPTMATFIAAKELGMLDDFVNDLSPEEREVAFHFPIRKVMDPLGRERIMYFRIPKPDYLQPIMNLSEGLIIPALKGEDQDSMSIALRAFMDTVSGVSPLAYVDTSKSKLRNLILSAFSATGPIVTTGAEVGFNLDTFSGREIVPERLEGLPPEEIAYAGTPDFYKRLAKKLRVPALQLQAMVEGGLSTGLPRDIFNIISAGSELLPDGTPKELQTKFLEPQHLARNMITRGFFKVGRSSVINKQSQDAMDEIDVEERRIRHHRNTQLDIAEKIWVSGNEKPLRLLAQSKDQVLRKHARDRIDFIRKEVSRQDRILKRHSVAERAIMIAVQMHQNPQPLDVLREFQRKKIATLEVRRIARKVFQNSRDAKEALAYGKLWLKSRAEL